MKPFLLNLLSYLLLTSSFRAAEPSNSPERIAKGLYQVSTTELVLFTSKDKPEERLAPLFTRFAQGYATYKWLYFNPASTDWVTGVGRVQEVYDKLPPQGEGVVVVPVPGHNTKIQAGGITVEWSRGNTKHGWIYFLPKQLTLKTLPGDQFNDIKSIESVPP